MEDALTFGGWLKRRHGGLGLTQKELAQQIAAFKEKTEARKVAAKSEFEAVGGGFAGNVFGGVDVVAFRIGVGIDGVLDPVGKPGDFQNMAFADLLFDADVPTDGSLRPEGGIGIIPRRVVIEIGVGWRAERLAGAGTDGRAGFLKVIDRAETPGELVAEGIIILPAQRGGVGQVFERIPFQHRVDAIAVAAFINAIRDLVGILMEEGSGKQAQVFREGDLVIGG